MDTNAFDQLVKNQTDTLAIVTKLTKIHETITLPLQVRVYELMAVVLELNKEIERLKEGNKNG